jgi:hypothetical protein
VNTIQVASNSTPTRPVDVVIDALDETDFKRLRATVEIFSQVVVDLPRNAKVFISSRAETIVLDNFISHHTNLRVRRISLDSIEEVTRHWEGRLKTL